MKKLLILLIIFSSCARKTVEEFTRPIKSRSASILLTDIFTGTTANDGTGWSIKRAFDTVNANNTTIEKAFETVPTIAEAREYINDSLDVLRGNALLLEDYVFLRSDANLPGEAMTYEGVVNYVASHEGGSGGYEWTSFIVGTTTGSPANTDTSFTISQMAGDVIELYRGTTADLHRVWLNETATNVRTGYRYNASGTIVVRPAWATNDRAYIRAVPSSSVTKDTLTGGVSGLVASLRAYWAMDETTGTALNDSYFNYDGTTNGTVNALGVIGRAVDFERDNSQYASFGNTVGDMGTDDFSISAWIYVESFPSALYSGIVGNWGDYPYWYIGVDSDDQVVGVLNFAGTNLELFGNGSISASAWHHIALTVDRSGIATLYVDGSAQTDTENISTHSAVDASNNNVTAIGRVGNDLTGYYFDGIIDEVAIYRGRVLSLSDVQEIYNGGSGNAYPF